VARLQNYLRTHRSRRGLSQAEVAILLGAVSGTKASRYENSSRMPNALTIFALEIIVFNQPASELFAGTYDAGPRGRPRARPAHDEAIGRTDGQDGRQDFPQAGPVTRHRRGETKCHRARLTMRKPTERRVLAVDPLSRGVGFAVL
jgi:transcriptional regulator with XRE-family HTH domain